MNRTCERCDGSRQIGLPSFPVPCPDCAGGDVLTDIERHVRSPRSFARLSAIVGYSDAECVTALVSETELTAEEAANIVAEEYQGFASREADQAAEDWLNDDGGDTAERRWA